MWQKRGGKRPNKEGWSNTEGCFWLFLKIRPTNGWVAAADRWGCLLSTGVRKPAERWGKITQAGITISPAKRRWTGNHSHILWLQTPFHHFQSHLPHTHTHNTHKSLSESDESRCCEVDLHATSSGLISTSHGTSCWPAYCSHLVWKTNTCDGEQTLLFKLKWPSLSNPHVCEVVIKLCDTNGHFLLDPC